MIAFTGDTHGRHDIAKLYMKNFPQQAEMTKDDYLIQLGDFGTIWSPQQDKEEISLLEEYNSRRFTTLFLQGNHENHTRLNSDEFPVVPMFGDYVKQISDYVFMLQTGHIYTINGETYFVFGGATSIDKEFRRPFISWWPEEIPTTKTMMEALDLLASVKRVDYILTHTTHSAMNKAMGFEGTNKFYDPMTAFLDEIKKAVEYRYWLHGHFHLDCVYNIESKTICLYNKVLLKDKIQYTLNGHMLGAHEV